MPDPLSPPSPVLGKSPTLNAPIKPEPRLRDIGDHEALRSAIYDKSLEAVKRWKPLDYAGMRLELVDPHYDGKDSYSLKDQKQAILERRSLGRRLRGTWQLTDLASGQVVDKKKTTLATIPYLTQRGTFIDNGNEYAHINQSRLRPGVYSRIKENGELETFVSVKPGQGVSHRYFLDPEKGVFFANIGAAKIPLVPLLHAMGISDKDMKEAWGPDIAARNMAIDQPHLIRKYHERLLTAAHQSLPENEKTKKLLERLHGMELDPEVTGRTMPKPYSNLSKEAVMDITKRLLAMSKGEAETDNRDDLAYQMIFGPEDNISERLEKDYGGYRKKLLWRAARDKNLRAAFPGYLNQQVRSALLTSGLGQHLEETNLSELLDKQFRITRMGEGGLSGDNVPGSARAVQNSYLGFIDPLKTPECLAKNTQVMTKNGWIDWPEVTEDTEFACLINGSLEYHRPIKLVAQHYKGIMYGARGRLMDYLVTPNHRMYIKCGSDCSLWKFEEAQVTHNKHCRQFISGGFEPYIGASVDTGLGDVELTTNNQINVDPNTFDLNDWAEFVGWFLSEGSFQVNGHFCVRISQSSTANSKNCDRIGKLLNRLPFKWHYQKNGHDFVISGKQLAVWASQFGYCDEKYIPQVAFEWPVEARKRLLESLLLGDGRTCVKKWRNGEKTMYCTTSKRLADDVQRLLFSLGKSSRIVFEPDGREERYLGCYVVHIHSRQIRGLQKKNPFTGESYYYTEDYDDMVYCAQVPGSLLYTRRNGSAGFWSGNSTTAGVDLYLSRGVKKGDDGKIYAPFLDPKTGETVNRSPQDIAKLTVAFPKQLEGDSKRVWAIRGGKLVSASKREVDLVLPHFENAFTPLSNLIPMKSAIKGQRASMTSRFLTQALPLVGAEAPLIQSGLPGGQRSFEQDYGEKLGAVFAKEPAKVMSVKSDEVKLRYGDGREETIDLHKAFPMNRRSVSGATVIYLQRGGRFLKTSIRDYCYKTGDLVLSIDSYSKCSAWLPVTAFTSHLDNRPLVKVKTASGRSVIITEDHSLVVMGQDGDLAPIFAKELRCGESRLPVALMGMTGDKEVELPRLPCNLNCTRDLGVLIGLYLSEGCCALGYKKKEWSVVNIAVKPKDRRAQVIKLLEGFGFKPFNADDNRKSPIENVSFSSKELATFLVENFGHLSGNKYIPDWVLSSNLEFVEGIISGYMAGDGGLFVTKAGVVQVTGYSISRCLRDGIIDLLSRLGIFTTLCEKLDKRTGRVGFGFRVINPHLSYFGCDGNFSWFFYGDKQSKFDLKYLESDRSSKYEAIPLPSKGKKILYAGCTAGPDHYLMKGASLGFISRRKLLDNEGIFGAWANSDVIWDVVTEINCCKSEGIVYDLSVEGSEVFAVNSGLVVHNTYYEQTLAGDAGDNEGPASTYFEQIPAVKAGDILQPGQLLAYSNYTDKKGSAALGVNAKVAYLADGNNHEDAITISESFAKRLSSDHMFPFRFDPSENHKMGRGAYVSLFPQKFNRKQLDTIDENGLVKSGTTVNYGDPLVLAVSERTSGGGRVHRKGGSSFSDSAITWEKHSPGTVTDSVQTPNGMTVLVRSVLPTQTADKLSSRWAAKGVVSKIVPDDEMPQDSQGQPFEVLLNPAGIPSRVNPAALIETALGKIATKTGQPFKVPDFDTIDDLTGYAQDQLRQHGLSDLEDVIDPKTGRKIPDILTGTQFIMKLHHLSAEKQHGRGIGSYTSLGSPSKGEGKCFAPKQKIQTNLGPVNISTICEKKLAVQALTYSEELAEWVYRPVVDWFVRKAPISDLICIKTEGGPCFGSNAQKVFSSSSKLMVTKNHVIYKYNGSQVPAQDITVGDQLVTVGPVPTNHQIEVLLGTLLGDGYAMSKKQDRESRGGRCGFEHGLCQKNYLDWKGSVLSGLLPKSRDTAHVRKKVTFDGRIVYKRSLAREVYLGQSYIWRPLRALCYQNGVKKFSKEWLSKLTDLSLAICFIDDGSMTNRSKNKNKVILQGSLVCTMGVDDESRELFVWWLNSKLGVDCSLKSDGGIYLPASACWRLVEIVSKWVPWQAIPVSKKVLCRLVKEIQESTSPNKIDCLCKLGKVPLYVSDIGPYVHDKPNCTEINVYDFTVDDTHRYVAGHSLVSNSKRLSGQETGALLASGAYGTLRDASQIRGQRNEDFWLNFMQGYAPPEPDIPLVYKKFVADLQASGINVVSEGTQTHVMALTDKDVHRLANGREVKSGELVDPSKDMRPLRGGLFDPQIFGQDGHRWGFIKAAEPVVNPVMEDPIRHLLGLTKKQFEDVLSGKEDVHGFGSGPTAIKKALQTMNIPMEIARARQDISRRRGSGRDAAVRKLRYLIGAQEQGLRPSDWLLTQIPVLPPVFRQVGMMQDTNIPIIPDANLLYRELIDANDNLKQMAGQVSDVGPERLAVYKAFKAVVGLGDPLSKKLQEKKIGGILQRLVGPSPKMGCFDDETEILTKEGWIRFPELIDDTEVATLNPSTGAFEWQMTDQVFHFEYNGEMVRTSTKHGLDMLVTPGHRNWVRPRIKKDGIPNLNMEDDWGFEEAFKTAAGTNRKWLRTAASAWSGHGEKPDFISDDCTPEQFAGFVGWWVAEGWIAGKKRDCVQILQSAKQSEYCAKIESLIKNTGLKYSSGIYGRGSYGLGKCQAMQWSIYSKQLAEWLIENCGNGARNKKLSRFILDWNKDCLEAFVDGYLSGDGGKRYKPRKNNGGVTHKNNGNQINGHSNAHTISSSLAGGLQEVFCKLGLTARIKLKTRVLPCQNIYRVNLSGSKFVVFEGEKHSELSMYNGLVHCVSVPNGIIYVRRSGRPFFSGNTVQRRLLSQTVDLVGRATLIPNPDLDMDSVAISEQKAWDVYRNFIVRRLKRKGMSISEAMRQVEEHTPLAKQEMLSEMGERPVLVSRAPVLHRYGIQAFWPRLTKNTAIELCPMVFAGFGADADGDALNWHVPVEDSAVREAKERLLPSKSLVSPADFKSPVHNLTQEYLGALHYMTTQKKDTRKPRTFATKKDAIAAWRRGEISGDDPVTVIKSA